jgi:hypothetical protein
LANVQSELKNFAFKVSDKLMFRWRKNSTEEQFLLRFDTRIATQPNYFHFNKKQFEIIKINTFPLRFDDNLTLTKIRDVELVFNLLLI